MMTFSYFFFLKLLLAAMTLLPQSVNGQKNQVIGMKFQESGRLSSELVRKYLN
jgi:hypothetical protein